jgi:hypothetical protein
MKKTTLLSYFYDNSIPREAAIVVALTASSNSKHSDADNFLLRMLNHAHFNNAS